MQELMTIKNVRGYIDENGTARLNLEDVSRGLGFIDGNSVRWSRVHSYLEGFGYFATSGDRQLQVNSDANIFIPENIFYRLAMKAKNETAEKFQAMVADEILPSIRKTGSYVNPIHNLSKELQAIFAIDKKQQVMESRVEKLENTMTIDYSQQEELRQLGNKTVVNALCGKGSTAYKMIGKKAFAELWRHLKRTMNVNSYRNIATMDFNKAKDVILSWKPDKELGLMIIGANTQVSMEDKLCHTK